MHSSMIGKVEKAMRYAHEPDRVRIQRFDATFAGDNGSHRVSLDAGRMALRVPPLRSGRRLHPHPRTPEDARPDADRCPARDAALRARRTDGRGGRCRSERRCRARLSSMPSRPGGTIRALPTEDRVGCRRRKADGQLEKPVRSRHSPATVSAPRPATSSPVTSTGVRSPARTRCPRPSRERERHHHGPSSSTPLLLILALLLACVRTIASTTFSNVGETISQPPLASPIGPTIRSP